MGASQDLEIFHDAATGHSRIKDTGTGNLAFCSSKFTVWNAADNEAMIEATENGSVDLYYNNVKKLNTESWGIKLLDEIALLDSKKFYFGNSNDLQIVADGSNSKITHNGDGNLIIDAAGSSETLYLQASDDVYIRSQGSTTAIHCDGGAAVNLYHNGSKKLETNSTGIIVTGEVNSTTGIFEHTTNFTSQFKFISSNESRLYHGSNAQVKLAFHGNGDVLRGSVNADANGVGFYTAANEWAVKCVSNAQVELYHDTTKVLNTEGHGVDMRHTVNIYGSSGGSNANLALRCTGGAVYNSIKMYNAAGNQNVQLLSHGGSTLFFYASHYNFCVGGTELIELTSSGWHPRTTSTAIDLGTSTKRWRNIYTQDLQLSNETSGGNEVDGTWGDYTIQEGESDLFLINRRNGKQYKFNLTEVN